MHVAMKLVHIQDLERPEGQGIFAKPLLEGDQSQVRIIRLAPDQALPAHRHGASDLMLYAVAGQGQLDLANGPVALNAGSLAFYRGDEELRVRNTGTTQLTLLAFLAPKVVAPT
jgi:quercetin dioxygenase-like cupin family protein